MSTECETPQLRYAQQLPFQGSQGGYAARVAKLATPTMAVQKYYRVREPKDWYRVRSVVGRAHCALKQVLRQCR